jgi:hypothetical protein
MTDNYSYGLYFIYFTLLNCSAVKCSVLPYVSTNVINTTSVSIPTSAPVTSNTTVLSINQVNTIFKGCGAATLGKGGISCSDATPFINGAIQRYNLTSKWPSINQRR